jgi:hypothetical protein
MSIGHVCMYVRMHGTHMYVCVYACVQAFTYVCMYVLLYMRIRLPVCVSVCMFVLDCRLEYNDPTRAIGNENKHILDHIWGIETRFGIGMNDGICITILLVCCSDDRRCEDEEEEEA